MPSIFLTVSNTKAQILVSLQKSNDLSFLLTHKHPVFYQTLGSVLPQHQHQHLRSLETSRSYRHRTDQSLVDSGSFLRDRWVGMEEGEGEGGRKEGGMQHMCLHPWSAREMDFLTL